MAFNWPIYYYFTQWIRNSSSEICILVSFTSQEIQFLEKKSSNEFQAKYWRNEPHQRIKIRWIAFTWIIISININPRVLTTSLKSCWLLFIIFPFFNWTQCVFNYYMPLSHFFVSRNLNDHINNKFINEGRRLQKVVVDRIHEVLR